MPRRRRRRRELHPSGPPSREEIDALEERIRYVEQKANMGRSISGVLSGEADVDDSYQYDWEGNAATSTEAVNAATVGGYTPAEIPYISDGAAPASSPVPTVVGGPLYFAVKWDVVANADLVTYEVHVIDSATRAGDPNWVTDASTLAGQTPGTLAYLRKTAAGVDFVYGTDYYVKLVAVDDDGSAAASAEVGPTQLNPNGSDEQLFGSITAEHLETVLALASSMIAGTWGAANAQMGFGAVDDGAGNPVVDPSFVGFRAFDTDGETITFSVDATTGNVFVGGTLGNTTLAGTLSFGAGSTISSDDTITLKDQPPGSYQTPAVVQSVSNFDQAPSPERVSCTWDAPTTDGNLLLMAVACYGAPTAPSLTTPSGWTRVGSVQQFFGGSNFRMALYYITSATSRSGTQIINCSGVLDAFDVVMMEVSGAEFFDESAADDGSGTAVDTTASGATDQDDEFVLAILGNSIDPDGTPTAPAPAGWTLAETVSDDDGGASGFARLSVYHKNVASIGAQQFTATLGESKLWSAKLATFTAKATALPASTADTLKLYAKDWGGVASPYIIADDGVERPLVRYSGARASRSTTVSLSNATWTAINTDTEHWDTDNYRDLGDTSGKFFVPFSGYYRVDVNGSFGTDANQRRAVGFAVNTAANPADQDNEIIGGQAGGNVRPSHSSVVFLDAGDYIRPFAYQDSGASLNLNTIILTVTYLGA